jgi:hypothetical protein
VIWDWSFANGSEPALLLGETSFLGGTLTNDPGSTENLSVDAFGIGRDAGAPLDSFDRARLACGEEAERASASRSMRTPGRSQTIPACR